MRCCSECGAPRIEKVVRGPLLIEVEPKRVYWKGVACPVTPTQCAILTMLARFGRVSFVSLLLCVGEETDSDALKVHVHHLRRRLPREITIANIYGGGYELLVGVAESNVSC